MVISNESQLRSGATRNERRFSTVCHRNEISLTSGFSPRIVNLPCRMFQKPGFSLHDIFDPRFSRFAKQEKFFSDKFNEIKR